MNKCVGKTSLLNNGTSHKSTFVQGDLFSGTKINRVADLRTASELMQKQTDSCVTVNKTKNVPCDKTDTRSALEAASPALSVVCDTFV